MMTEEGRDREMEGQNAGRERRRQKWAKLVTGNVEFTLKLKNVKIERHGGKKK